jgi:hypothetical protein
LPADCRLAVAENFGGRAFDDTAPLMVMRPRETLFAAGFCLAAMVTLDVGAPRPAYAAGTCSLTALVCANDSSPGCEAICRGEQMPTCEQGSCSLGGNVAAVNRCYCK